MEVAGGSRRNQGIRELGGRRWLKVRVLDIRRKQEIQGGSRGYEDGVLGGGRR